MNITKTVMKLKPDELRALVEIFECTLTIEAESRQDAIVVLMMLKLYRKLKEKSIIIDGKMRMQIPTEYALGFVEYFETVHFDRTTFGGNILMKLLNQFDQQTASLYGY